MNSTHSFSIASLPFVAMPTKIAGSFPAHPVSFIVDSMLRKNLGLSFSKMNRCRHLA
jgi:hypothetical protein